MKSYKSFEEFAGTAELVKEGVYVNGNIAVVIVKPRANMTNPVVVSVFEKTKKGIGSRYPHDIFGDYSGYMTYNSSYEDDRSGKNRKIYDDYSSINHDDLPLPQKVYGGYRFGAEVIAREVLR